MDTISQYRFFIYVYIPMVELLKNDALEAVKSPKEVKKYKPAKPIDAPKEELPDFEKG